MPRFLVFFALAVASVAVAFQNNVHPTNKRLSTAPTEGKAFRLWPSATTTMTRTTTTTSLNAIASKKVQAAMQSNNFLRGKLLLILSRFLVAPTVYLDAIRCLLMNTYWPEVAVIAALANSMPIAQWMYLQQCRRAKRKQAEQQQECDDESGVVELLTEEEKEEETAKCLQDFSTTKSHKLAMVLHQFGFLQATLYISDVVLGFLRLLNFGFVAKYQAKRVAGAIIFSTWLAYNLSRLKLYYLQNAQTWWSMSSSQRRRQKLLQQQHNGAASTTTPSYNRFANRILDVIIYMCALLIVVDMLGIQIGFALKSIFGLGSFGTLVLSLASKDVAAEFVGGLMIQSSNFFDEGETVVLQDGTRGVVMKVGWLHTYIQKDDDYVVRVPNSQVSHQRIAREKRATSSRRNRKGYL